MKVKFCIDNGANIHSKRDVTIDLYKEFEISKEDWESMDEDERLELVIDFWDGLSCPEYYYEEL